MTWGAVPMYKHSDNWRTVMVYSKVLETTHLLKRIVNTIFYIMSSYFFPNPFLFLKADWIFAAAASTSGSLRSISKELC